MLRCREVTEIVGTDHIVGAPWRTRLQVRLHLMICRHCRAYVRSLRQLAQIARRAADESTRPPDARDDAVIAAVLRASAALPPPPDQEAPGR